MNSSPKWLLIDDDEDDQEIFTLALHRVDRAIQCTYVTNGASALEKLQVDEAYTPDCIFIDMNMPIMNGLQTLKELKMIPRLGPTPVFLYSTSADPVSMSTSRQLGATDFIVKPASIPELAEILTRLM